MNLRLLRVNLSCVYFGCEWFRCTDGWYCSGFPCVAWKKKNLLLCYFAASTFAFKLKCTHISANKTAYKEFYWHILGGWRCWWCICCRLFPKEFIIEVFILSAITYAFHKFASFEVYPGEMNHIQQQEMKEHVNITKIKLLRWAPTNVMHNIWQRKRFWSMSMTLFSLHTWLIGFNVADFVV